MLRVLKWILVLLGAVTFPAIADVYYDCNMKVGTITVQECNEGRPCHGSKGSKVEEHDLMTVETVRDKSLGERYLRKSLTPKVFTCALRSGTYQVTFEGHWFNSNVMGMNGGETSIAVKIEHDAKPLIPRTIIGPCDTGRSIQGDCLNWAVRIFLFHSGDIPKATVERATTDWVR